MAEKNEKTCSAGKVITLTFNPTDTPIRMETINGTLWFVAKDVCKALNITWSGHTLDQIPDEWKGMVKFTTPGGTQELTTISESGMYKLAFRCQSSEAADRFTNWIAGEVLPSIRKTGGYGIPERVENAMRAKALPAGRVKPRERSAELGDFYRELRLWVRSADVDEVAEMSGVRRKSVLEVLSGNRMGTAVLELLVAYAKENRFDGRLTDIASNATRARRSKLRMEQLRIDFMDGHLPVGREGGAL